MKDLKAVKEEIGAYSREEDIWIRPPGLPNSAGTLVLHVTGNLRHFIGATLGGIAYVRDREAEFTDLLVPRAELEMKIDRAIEAVGTVLDGLDETRLTQEYPLDVAGAQWSIGMFLMRLVSHLAYHLGQINYHRHITTAHTGGHGQAHG